MIYRDVGLRAQGVFAPVMENGLYRGVGEFVRSNGASNGTDSDEIETAICIYIYI